MDKNLLIKDFKDLKITEDTRKYVLEHPSQFSSCDARIRMGKFYTDKQLEERREKSLNTPLPGGKLLTKTK